MFILDEVMCIEPWLCIGVRLLQGYILWPTICYFPYIIPHYAVGHGIVQMEAKMGCNGTKSDAKGHRVDYGGINYTHGCRCNQVTCRGASRVRLYVWEQVK